ncbi:hypothetical protein HDU97_003113 [Phlyctochytrium planicorne]|nr:hypothetical protein HDU97_003064 [Phlyctochytrium planicorne]KAJ3109684.1 hypothetical protein HDU97_003113 [Phlyctochytrium planicorne]
MLAGIYFTLVVVEFARDFRKSPEKYHTHPVFSTYENSSSNQTFIVYTNGQPQAYPPQPRDPYAVDLPVYQPPLPSYDNVPKGATGANPSPSAATASEIQPPAQAVSREPANQSNGQALLGPMNAV